MISFDGGPARLCDGLVRRDFLRLGALGPLGFALPALLKSETKARAAGKHKARADACILFYLQGGQSHIDTFDMKPGAPEQIRGPFKSIATRTPGHRIVEYLPLLAGMSDKYALIRSMTHKATNHNPGGYVALTGVPPARDVVALGMGADDHPNPGAVLSKLRPVDKPVPTFVQLSRPVLGDGNATPMPGMNAGFLGAAFDPLKVTPDPNEPGFGVDELALPDAVSPKRFDRRRSLLETVEKEFPLIGELPEVARMDTFYQRAYQLVTSPEARRAFDLRQEPASLRDRYGRNTYGQSLLLARRLVESGVRMVSVYWGGPLNLPDDFWDTHQGNMPKQKDKLLPRFDQCLSALLTDLEDRGLLERTLVIAMGEFGRTPKIGQVTANAGTDASGRDHWPFCYTIQLAGAGIRGGHIIGKSDGQGAYPVERPVTPDDLMATLYHCFGIEPETELRDRLNRPIPVSRGEPVMELFA